MVDQSLRAALAPVADAATLDILFGEDTEAIAALPAAAKAALRERLKALKTIDPACGSGAFPMGLLNRMVGLLADLGEQNTYQSKLHLIEQGIYGVDIQPIAIQISKLRFFISLLCDQTPDPSRPNAGLDQLPNLETHLVIANSLIGFNDGENYIIPTHIQALREELKGIRAKYVQAHTRAEKLKFRARDRELRTQIQDHFRAMRLSGVDLLSDWNPYDPTVASPFFDPQWMFGIDTFDIVIGNPPYVKVKKGIFSVTQYPYSEGQDKGEQNLYKVFIEMAYNVTKADGHVCLIVQGSLMCDKSAVATRLLLLTQAQLLQVLEFPKDTPDPEAKVFKNVLTGTCIVLFRKTQENDFPFGLSIHNTLKTLRTLEFAKLSQKAILDGKRGFEFPLIREKEAGLYNKMRTQFQTFKSVIVGSSQGNIHSSKRDKFISHTPSTVLLGKGDRVHRYELSQDLLFATLNAEVKALVKKNAQWYVVAMQNITGQTDRWRLHACFADCKRQMLVFLDSANLVYWKTERDAFLGIGLLNSKLLDWVFRTTSTNNHVNQYEIANLPIPSEESLASPDGERLVALVRRAEAGEDVQAEIDAVVYRLYGLTGDEIALVERSFAKREKRAEAPAVSDDEGAEEDEEA